MLAYFPAYFLVKEKNEVMNTWMNVCENFWLFSFLVSQSVAESHAVIKTDLSQEDGNLFEILGELFLNISFYILFFFFSFYFFWC